MTDVGFVALACGLIIGIGALGACIGVGLMAASTSRPRRASRADEHAADQGLPAARPDRRFVHHRRRHRAVVRDGQPVRSGDRDARERAAAPRFERGCRS